MSMPIPETWTHGRAGGERRSGDTALAFDHDNALFDQAAHRVHRGREHPAGRAVGCRDGGPVRARDVRRRGRRDRCRGSGSWLHRPWDGGLPGRSGLRDGQDDDAAGRRRVRRRVRPTRRDRPNAARCRRRVRRSPDRRADRREKRNPLHRRGARTALRHGPVAGPRAQGFPVARGWQDHDR